MPDIRHAIEPEEIMAYLDGELPPARAAEAMMHLDACAECRQLAGGLRTLSQQLTAWQVEPPRPMTAPAGAIERPKWTLRSLIRIPAYALAIAGVCIVAAFVAITLPRRHTAIETFVMDGPLAPDSQTKFVTRAGSNSIGNMPADNNGSLQSAAPPQAQPVESMAAKMDALEPAGPMIERTATLNLTTRDFNRLRGRIDAILARRHGYIAELTVNTPEGAGRSLNATIRIPAAELDSALADFRQLGRVESESQKGEDVTRSYADLVARLANARNTEQRLTQLLAQRTGKLSDVLAVEREMARVRGDIEQMEAERRTTADQVAMATLQLNAGEDYQAQLRLSPDSTLTRLRNAAVDGYKNLAVGLLALALAAIAYGPSMLLWGAVLFFIVRFVVRRRRLSRTV